MQILRVRDKLGANYSRLFEKAFNEFEDHKRRAKEDSSCPAGSLDLKNQPESTVVVVAKAAVDIHSNNDLSITKQTTMPSQSSSASSSNSALLLSNTIKVNNFLI